LQQKAVCAYEGLLGDDDRSKKVFASMPQRIKKKHKVLIKSF
jgi:hypothetical protein